MHFEQKWQSQLTCGLTHVSYMSPSHALIYLDASHHVERSRRSAAATSRADVEWGGQVQRATGVAAHLQQCSRTHLSWHHPQAVLAMLPDIRTTHCPQSLPTCTVRSSRPHCRLSSGAPVTEQQAEVPGTQAAGVRWQGHRAACRTDCASGCTSAWQLSCRARMLPTSGCLNCGREGGTRSMA